MSFGCKFSLVYKFSFTALLSFVACFTANILVLKFVICFCCCCIAGHSHVANTARAGDALCPVWCSVVVKQACKLRLSRRYIVVVHSCGGRCDAFVLVFFVIPVGTFGVSPLPFALWNFGEGHSSFLWASHVVWFGFCFAGLAFFPAVRAFCLHVFLLIAILGLAATYTAGAYNNVSLLVLPSYLSKVCSLSSSSSVSVCVCWIARRVWSSKV